MRCLGVHCGSPGEPSPEQCLARSRCSVLMPSEWSCLWPGSSSPATTGVHMATSPVRLCMKLGPPRRGHLLCWPRHCQRRGHGLISWYQRLGTPNPSKPCSQSRECVPATRPDTCVPHPPVLLRHPPSLGHVLGPDTEMQPHIAEKPNLQVLCQGRQGPPVCSSALILLQRSEGQRAGIGLQQGRAGCVPVWGPRPRLHLGSSSSPQALATSLSTAAACRSGFRRSRCLPSICDLSIH